MAVIQEDNIIISFQTNVQELRSKVVEVNDRIGDLSSTSKTVSAAINNNFKNISPGTIVEKIKATEGAAKALDSAFKKLGNNDLGGFESELTDLIAKTELTADEFQFLEQNIQEISKALATMEVDEIKNVADTTGVLTKKFTTAKQELRALTNAITSGDLDGEDLDKAIKRAAALTDEIGDVREQIKNLSSDTVGIDTLIEGTRAVAAGFSIVEGAAAAFGEENEDVQKALIKLNGIMAISNGLQEVHALLLQNSNLRMRAAAISQGIYNTVVGTSTGALKLFRIALAATGVGLLVIILGALIANFDSVKKSITSNAQAIFDFGKKVTTFLPPLNALVKAGEYVYKNFDKIKISIFALDDAISGFFGSLGDVLGNLFSGDFDAAYESFNQIGANTAKAFLKGQQDELIKQRDNNLANTLIERNKTLARSVKLQESLGKDSFETQKQILVNELNTLRLQNADKEKILDKETEYQELINKRTIDLSEKAKDNAKKAEENKKKIDEYAKKARENALKDELDAKELEFQIQENNARREIKDAEELEQALKIIELRKGIALAEIKQKYATVGSLDAEKETGEILKLNTELSQLTGVRVPLNIDLLPTISVTAASNTVKVGIERIKELRQQIYDGVITDEEGTTAIDGIITSLTDQLTAGLTSVDLEGKTNILNTLLTGGDLNEAEIEADIKNKVAKIKEIEGRINISLANSEGQAALESLQLEKANAEIDLEKTKADAKQKINDAYYQKIKDQELEVLSKSKELTDVILGELIARKDKEIEIAQERLNGLISTIDQGNTEQVQLEEERLAKLTEEREKFANAQKRIAAIEIAANNAVAISAAIAGLSKAYALNIFAGIAATIGLAASIASTLIVLNNAFSPSFKSGIEDTGVNGSGIDGQGGFRAILHPKERVLTKEQNAPLLKAGISNQDLPKMALMGLAYRNGSIQQPNNNSDLLKQIKVTNKKLDALTNAMQGAGMTVNISDEGILTMTNRASSRIDKLKSIRQ